MVTTLLDLLGSLLVITGLAWWLAVWTGIIASGFLVAGAGLLLLSWIIDRPRKPWRKRQKAGGER